MKKHSLDLLSLIFGLVFVLIASTWVIRRSVDVELPDAGWFLAGALVLAGVLGIVSFVRSAGKTPVDSSESSADTPPPAE